jgi:ubiquinone/menaquinone biosynthesis C-methylase UbiE
MSSFVWMKVLESTPERYDRGIRLLSLGRIEDVYRRIAETVAGPGRRVLDIGCGTGGVSLACAARGAHVIGIDLNAGMLEVARSKPVPEGGGSVEWLELDAAEIQGRVPEESLDAVVSCLAFSELSPEEQTYVLRVAFSRLKPGGELVIADEAASGGAFGRAWRGLRRLPLVLLTYLLTQTTTRPVSGLAERVRAAGFARVEQTELWSGSFLFLHAARQRLPT